MLPRVSAAITQFLAPIASSTRQPQARQRAEPEFKRHSPPKKDPGQDPGKEQGPGPGADILPFPSKIKTDETEQLPAPKAVMSVAHAFIQLLAMFQQRRSAMFRKLGAKSYETSLKGQNQKTRFRKGAMLDQKAE